MEWQPLDFERPIFDLERRLEDLKNHSDKHDVDLDPAMKELETKLRETRRRVYGNLTAWQRVQIARHTQRPFALDYIERCFTNWLELHGDRRFADDRAMPCGLAMLGPVISLIDTPGAFPGIGSEERHISEAIAVNLREMMRLRVPIVAAVIGEGGSGGALGIGVADRVLILENAYYSVISPEACSAILWRDRRHAAEAAEALKLTAQDLMKLEVVDEIVPEPQGGAHRDYDSVAANVGTALRRALQQVSHVPIGELLEKRYQKFRRLGVFSGGKTAGAATGF